MSKSSKSLICKICGTYDLDGVFSVSGIGPVCYSCFQKPQKGSHREQMAQKHGKRIAKKDHTLGEFV